ncbi:MAG TPA: ribokinase [Bacillota bacterium]|nr:ribokinase [Bacillota bacterium]
MRKIFVIGSMNMDMVFRVPVVPQRGETIMGDAFFMNPGGKGANQAVACARQGAEVRMIGAVGTDVFGTELVEALQKAGIPPERIAHHPQTPTGTALILITGSDNRIVVAAGANAEVSPHQIEEGLRDALPGDVLLMQMEIPYPSIVHGFSLAKQKGMFTVLNPAPAQLLDEALLKNVDLIVPNETEAEKITGFSAHSPLFSARAIPFFIEQGVKEVVITLGASGCIYGNGETIMNIPAQPVEVVDTTAAGDTFVGSLAVTAASGAPVASGLFRATCAAALTISKMGAQCSIPTGEEIDRFMEECRKTRGSRS